ncbi:uncharacterized protein, possibly involved in utilization of glycolate and propanediol [Burkholderiales bacterium JOSHI_001]|nr:uncharacterized protein, possibly involved in utilization of glycolate and propanediol [Burkholderiales bacterium JOSHI_001]
MSKTALIAASLLAATATLAHAGNGVRSERNITLEGAQRIAEGAIEDCVKKGFNVSVAVVDRSGVLRTLLRSDNAGPHTPAASQAKAFTSASARNNTTAILATVQSNPAAATLVDIPGFLVLGGGVPIRSGNEVIGAIGVAGAPGGALDEQCALAGIDKAKGDLE